MSLSDIQFPDHNPFYKIYDLSICLIEQLRDRVWIGAILLLISTPFLARFFYQNWHLINELQPYFTNAAQDK